ncbi:MAG TPA: hypothetical protein VGO11_12360, partial [Chthoniobacteraceae bacterium]|nr:hypothetical protein [Chthoniobacteraceae bacterium]
MLLLIVIAIVYYGTYLKHGLNFHDDGATVALDAKRLLDGEVPFRDVDLGYNVLWFYPVVGLFKLFGVNFVLLRAYCFTLSVLTAVLAFLTLERVSRQAWLAFVVALLLVLVPGMTFKNYMPLLAVANIWCLVHFALGARPRRVVEANEDGTTAAFLEVSFAPSWGWLIGGAFVLGLTFLIRIDVGTFFLLLWLGGEWLIALRPQASAGARMAMLIGGPLVTIVLATAVHVPVYLDAVHRGFDKRFVAAYQEWPKELVTALEERLHAPPAGAPALPAPTDDKSDLEEKTTPPSASLPALPPPGDPIVAPPAAKPDAPVISPAPVPVDAGLPKTTPATPAPVAPAPPIPAPKDKDGLPQAPPAPAPDAAAPAAPSTPVNPDAGTPPAPKPAPQPEPSIPPPCKEPATPVPETPTAPAATEPKAPPAAPAKDPAAPTSPAPATEAPTATPVPAAPAIPAAPAPAAPALPTETPAPSAPVPPPAPASVVPAAPAPVVSSEIPGLPPAPPAPVTPATEQPKPAVTAVVRPEKEPNWNTHGLRPKTLADLATTKEPFEKALILLRYAPLFTLVPLAIWAFFASLLAWRSNEAGAMNRPVAALLVIGGALTIFPQYFFWRSDSPHISEFMPGYWVGAFAAVLLLGWSDRRRTSWMARTFACLFLVALAAHAGLYLWRMLPDRWTGTIAAWGTFQRHGHGPWHWKPKATTLFHGANGVDVYVGKNESAALEQLKTLVNAHSGSSSDYLVAYPYHPQLNLLLDRRTYEKNVYVDNATSGRGWNEAAIARIQKYRPNVIVLSDWAINGTDDSRFSVWAEPTK